MTKQAQDRATILSGVLSQQLLVGVLHFFKYATTDDINDKLKKLLELFPTAHVYVYTFDVYVNMGANALNLLIQNLSRVILSFIENAVCGY